MNIVIPMAGLGSRFASAGYKKPKPFIDILGKPMIERVIENLPSKNSTFILIGRREHFEAERKLTDHLIRKYNVTVIGIDKLTEGTVCTVLYSHKLINSDRPLLIANSDQIVDVDLVAFVADCESRNLDGSILTFTDKERNPKWSFAKLDENGIVLKTKEKEAISDLATVGIYFFSKGKYFVNAAIDMIVENDRVNNEFYTCPVYNYAIRDGLRFGTFNIHVDQMHGIGIPEDFVKYVDLLKSGK